MPMASPLRLETPPLNSCHHIQSIYQVPNRFKSRKTGLFAGVTAQCKNASIRTLTITKPRHKKQRESYNKKDLKAMDGVKRILNKQERRLKHAVDNLHFMGCEAVCPDFNTYIYILQRCINMKALIEGTRVHVGMLKAGFEPCTYMENYLLTMYVKCGNLCFARQVFDKMRERDEVSWTAMISGYAQNGLGIEALCLFDEMQRAGISPNEFTFVSILKVCAAMEALEQGKQVHASVIKNELECNVYLSSVLVDLYATCGSLGEARHVFDKVPMQDDVSWSAIIKGYAQHGYPEEALMLFQEMQKAGMKPNKFAVSSILKACASLDSPSFGRQIHAYITKIGFDSNIYVASALVDMYAKYGNLAEAHKVFDEMPERDRVSWTVLMVGYEQHGFGEEALRLLCQLQREGVKIDKFIISSALSACRNLKAINDGKCVHAHVIRTGMETDTNVASAIIHMYANCGTIQSARQVYDRISKKDMAVSSAMLAVYSKYGRSKKAFEVFHQMQRSGLKPDQFACASVLSSCAGLAALEQGKQVHAYTVRNGLELQTITRTALIDMYSKSGNIEEARRVFDESLQNDVVSWNAMIIGYSKHGLGKEALQLFRQMQKLGMMPNDITYVGVLCACSHAGVVDEGRYFFDSMRREHGIAPKIEHYACMVDLLSHAGCLNEAYDLIKRMPFDPDAAVWGALLAGCRNHANMGLGRVAAGHLYKLEPQNSAHYRALSNMYAASGRWGDVERVNKMMRGGVIRDSKCSWIEVNNRVHTFLVGDKSHPQTKDIYATLDILANHMKDAGYVPDTNCMLLDVEKKQKEHSEKLAIAFGLISTPPGTCIRIVKNLNMCGDCHTASKFISKMVRRDIILRDINCVHHFKDGFCSCGDYLNFREDD